MADRHQQDGKAKSAGRAIPEPREKTIRWIVFSVLFAMSAVCAGLSVHSFLKTTNGHHDFVMGGVFLLMAAFLLWEARSAFTRSFR